MAIAFNAGFAPEVFDTTPVWEKKTLLASAGANDYKCAGSAKFPEALQVSLNGYKGFFPTPKGATVMLTGDIEIWECVCIRDTDYTVIGELSQRAFAKE